VVLQILEQRRENPNLDTSILETDVDNQVYKLYGLTEEEIRIIEES
jgi:hypothetical protein